MSKSRRPNRPYVRPGRTSGEADLPLELGSDAARLASLAGSARASIEPLEPRKMLFALTIDADDDPDNDGIGTVTAEFGYRIPYLVAELPDAQDPEMIEEEFEDENLGNVQSGTTFMDSEILLTFITESAAPATMLVDGMDDQDLELRFGSITVDESFTFGFQSDGDGGGATPRLATGATFTFEAAGLSVDPMMGNRIELLLNGNVVQTIEGNDLDVFYDQATGQLGLQRQAGFDAVRISRVEDMPSGGQTMVLDSIEATFPGGQWGSFHEERVFGAAIVLTGPVGSGIEVLDLYGRQMVLTLPQLQDMVHLIDPNDDGVPDFNDGIGRINLIGSTSETVFNLIGFTYDEMDREFTDPEGFGDAFQETGFGYDIDFNQMPPVAVGLPARLGSVIIGSPFIRDNSTAGAYTGGGFFVPRGPASFNSTELGVFADGSVGSMLLHGAVIGQVDVAGSVGRIGMSSLPGTVTVEGDLGSLIVQGDSGQFIDADGFGQTTGGSIQVGRTVGQIHYGGASEVSLTVLGDVNDPARAPLDFVNYTESEYVLAIDPATDNGRIVSMVMALNATDSSEQPVPFGTDFFRNDSILSAEYVGYAGSLVQLSGNLESQDPVNTGKDISDVYAFSAIAGQEIVINSTVGDAGEFLVRVLNRDGEALASAQDQTNPGVNELTFDGGIQLRFVASQTDVYYLSFSTLPSGNFANVLSYAATVNGMAPTTLGQHRAVLGIGSGTVLGPGGAQTDMFVNVQAGSVGLFSVGTGLVAGDGMETVADDATNLPTDNLDLLLNLGDMTLTSAGDLYAFVGGSDITGGSFLIGGDLGTFVTGRSALVAQNVDDGDLEAVLLQIGGQIGEIDVFGAVGFQQDMAPEAPGISGDVIINTGTAGGPGHIGSFTVGAWVQGQSLTVNTSPNSVVGAFIVGTRGSGNALAGSLDDLTPVFNLGAGSDVRFTDFARIETPIDGDSTDTIFSGQTVQYTDDAGANFTIQVTGPGSFATIRFLPVDGSEGVAIGRIDATLNGGGDLVINGLTEGLVSIGRINILTDGSTGPTGNPASQLRLTGQAEIDVWRVVSGGALGLVANDTVGGDFVALDLAGVTDVRLSTGDLGRTERTGIGPGFAPVLGIAQGAMAAANGPITLDAALVNANWDGSLFVPLAAGGLTNTLEDFGSPFDQRLNGLIVRAGDVQSVRGDGAIGDVILTNGDLQLLRANEDGLGAPGVFEGIIGSIFANNIVNLDVGDGVLDAGPTAFARAGIFAANDINLLTGRSDLSPVISGLIIAANNGAGNDIAVGIQRILFEDALITDAYIAVSSLDAWWWADRQGAIDGGNPDPALGDITLVDLSGTDLVRSVLFANNIVTVDIRDGAYDATATIARNDVTSITASEFRNSTRLGESTEFRANRIDVTGDLNRVQTSGNGRMADLVIDVQGDITDEIRAFDFERVRFNVDSTINEIVATNDIRAVEVDAGELLRIFAANDIRSSLFTISGPVDQIEAGSNITGLRVVTTGPDGRIETVQARFFLTGDIISSGGIGRITSTESDIIADVRTTMAGASLGTIEAGRDIVVSMDIRGDVTLIEAGRHVGRLGEEPRDRAIVVRGNAAEILAPNGQVYTGFQVGGQITGRVQMGRVAALPGNDLVSDATIQSFGRINLVEVEGDFDGRIVSFSGGIGQVLITRGSMRPGSSIEAFDGSIDLVRVLGGHLMGDVISEQRIRGIEVLGFEGFRGDLGVNFRLDGAAGFDDFRNQLPPDAEVLPTFNGPRIQAGTNIGRIIVSGSAIEAEIIAGHYIGTVEIGVHATNDNITSGLGGNFIVAGDRIDNVFVGGFAGGLVIHAGMLDLGADDRPGGVGANEDVVQFGVVGQVTIGAAGAVSVSAGMEAGADGLYGINPDTGTTDDLVANGKSRIDGVTVNGPALDTTAFADNGLGPTSPGVVRGGPGLGQAEPDKVLEAPPRDNPIAQNTPTTFTTLAGEEFTVTWSGPGRVHFVQSEGLLALVNTTLESSVTVDVPGAKLTDFNIISNDGANANTVLVRSNMFGNSGFYIDGTVLRAVFGSVDAPGGLFGTGRTAGEMVFGTLVNGRVEGGFISNLVFGGTVGRDAVVDLLGIGSLTLGRDVLGTIAVDRDIGVLNTRDIIGGAVRAGSSIGTLNARNLQSTFISAFNGLNAVNISGSVTDSLLSAGGDLGSDARFGGMGDAADRVGNGFIGSVNIGGDFTASDIAAGVLRGADGFLGTSDDVIDEGRSFIGDVTIGGRVFGSTFNSEAYRIISNGTLGTVIVGGNEFERFGNLETSTLAATVGIIEVIDLRVDESNRVYTGEIMFSRPINSSTFAPALTVTEVRDSGAIEIELVEGDDYVVEYDEMTNTGKVIFATEVTNRDLADAAGGLAGPGVYRFDLDADVLRGETQNALLDGDGDAIAGLNDSYSEEQIVGDAGDKLTANTTMGGIDFYGPADLDLVLDSAASFNGLPDPNQEYTVRGSLGDHPDTDFATFRPGGDADVYAITLTTGQILRLGQLEGEAFGAVQQIYDSDGNLLIANSFGFFAGLDNPRLDFLFGAVQDPISFDPSQIGVLPTTAPGPDNTGGVANLLIKETGQYFVVVTTDTPFFQIGTGDAPDVTDPNAVSNLTAGAGTTGSYAFSIELFEDGDSGFSGDSGAGDGVAILTAPLPSDAGFDAGGTVVDEGFTFTLNFGADGERDTADDLVSGSNGAGLTAERRSGADGVFGTTDDVLTSFAAASIGAGGLTGAPGVVAPDVDVYHLNGRETIAPGTRITATLRLTEFGSNLGLAAVPDFDQLVFDTSFAQDLRGNVQFSIFDTTNSTTIDDAVLVAAPDVAPVGGLASESVTDGSTTYGYNDDGDFFISFLTPARQDVGGNAPATFALYVQGAIRSDYRVEIVQSGAATFAARAQNVLIETRGGTIDWLEQGIETVLSEFDTSTVGFSGELGRVGGQDINSFVVSELMTELDAIFGDAGVDVRFSTNSADFEGEDFSTVFLTATSVPGAFFNNNTFGASEHADAFNADRNDEAVVFLPSLAVLGNPATTVGVDSLIQGLTTSVSRRVGELVGLRTTNSTFGMTGLDALGSNSVLAANDATVFRFLDEDRALSASTDVLDDTNFYLGQENAANLLDRILAAR